MATLTGFEPDFRRAVSASLRSFSNPREHAARYRQMASNRRDCTGRAELPKFLKCPNLSEAFLAVSKLGRCLPRAGQFSARTFLGKCDFNHKCSIFNADLLSLRHLVNRNVENIGDEFTDRSSSPQPVL